MAIILEQSSFLFLFMLCGFILGKSKIINYEHTKILSVLGVYLFLPCTVFNAFYCNFTVNNISKYYLFIIVSAVLLFILICVAKIISKFLTKDHYEKKIYEYTLTISNYAYMGYALAEGLYGTEGLLLMVLFALPFSIYSNTGGYCMLTKRKKSFKTLMNPVIISILLGIFFGITNIGLPNVMETFINKSSNCMAPVSMLLAGIAISRFRIKSLVSDKNTYIVCALRLIIIPLFAMIILKPFFNSDIVLCAVLLCSMPCGFNTIVFPKLVGESEKTGAKLIFISNIVAVLTIPLILNFKMILKEEYFTMSDGVKLYTRIVLPEENQKFPIIFMRSPYEEKRNGVPYPIENYKDNLFIKNGYAFIWQHTRGRGDSEGDCSPYIERQDGLDSLEIIRSLPFYNGEIYITGSNYSATVHLCYLDSNPKDIKAAALSVQTDRIYLRNYRNGCCFNFCNYDWWLLMLKNRYPNQAPFKDILKRPYYKIMERAVVEDVPEYTKMLLNDEYNDFWINSENTYAADKLDIPTLFLGGWYDFYIDRMFSMWERLSQKTKNKSAFVVGPWGHATSVTQPFEYSLENGNIPADHIVKFFNSIRDNSNYRDFELVKVNYYTIGKDYWTTDKEPSGKLKLYFNNNNKLSEKISVKGTKSYAYDPENKPHYFKFHNIFKFPLENKPDGILTFMSEPFEKETDFYGRINWNMKVKTDCDDTAFFIRIYFVEDGVSYNLTETITTVPNINKNYIAGEECIINIDTPPIAFCIKKGGNIRIDISSHSDLYVPHSNTKDHWAKVTETKIATNTLICDEDSYIILSLS